MIVVDNDSKDGSREFFRGRGAVVIENDGNYSYPYCQNAGIRVARHDLLAFLNNDVIVAPAWDKNMMAVMEKHDLGIVSPCGIEMMENSAVTKAFRRRWKIIRHGLGVFGHNDITLRAMHKIMYGNWERFNGERFNAFSDSVTEGFIGCGVIMTRAALEKVGLWDEKIQTADFDLFMRTKKRSLDVGDIRPMHISLGVFQHHYIRLTLKSGHAPFQDQARLISLEDKWGRENILKYLAHRESLSFDKLKPRR